jgi:hypothetical protein
MRYAALILIVLSGCGSEEGPPAPVVSDNEVSMREMLEMMKTDCYQRVRDFELQHEERTKEELLAASADKSTLMEYLVTSGVRAAEFDLEICRRYSQCYDISDEKRTMYVVSCIGQREQHRNEIAEL